MSNSPRDVLLNHFPSLEGQLLISGGWGMSQQDACCIECENAFSLSYEKDVAGWPIIYMFVEKRIYMELIVARPLNDRYSGIDWLLLDRQTKVENGRVYEWLSFEVSAFSDKDWDQLKAEWEGTEGIRSNNFDIESHNRRRAALTKKNVRDYWFDVTNCYSRSLFDIHLPWVVGSFGRGKIVNYETHVVGQGYSVAYHELFNPNAAEATVYFYTTHVTDIPEDCEDEKIEYAFRAAIDEVVFVNKNQLKSKTNVVQIGKLSLYENGPAFLHAEFDIITESERKKSHLFFRGHAGLFLKIRISFPADDKSTALPFLFLQKFANLGLGLQESI